MDITTIVIIAVVLVIVAGGAAIAARFSVLPAARTNRLRKRFGPEYDRALKEHGDKASAERELSERLGAIEKTKLRKLSPEERGAHVNAWAAVQQEFVDDPVSALRDARGLTDTIMRDLGYPERPSAVGGGADDESFDQRVRDLSVEHPTAVARYRDAQAAGHLAEANRTTTEGLREALVAYRGLVDALLGGLPTSNDARTAGTSHRPE
ncbi:hypothetical protein [Nocardiopsis ganjiahuensis]|uniref:hypothetical protein n=1 Tax=Nocardiopsis ganjiahuensis TaxID=239984 RepID=UPI00034B1AF3|nr:hypothetical protein [Nocardiopsis ganjiahuensis]